MPFITQPPVGIAGLQKFFFSCQNTKIKDYYYLTNNNDDKYYNFVNSNNNNKQSFSFIFEKPKVTS